MPLSSKGRGKKDRVNDAPQPSGEKQTVLVLEVVSMAHKGKQFEVGPQGATLGRKGLSLMYYKATGQIRFPEDDDRVSHKHATISKIADAAEYSIVDTGSLNGTFVNGERLGEERATSEPRKLLPGCLLNVGPYDFKVSYKEVESKGKPPKKLADRRSAGVQKWRRWFNDTTAHLDKGGSARDLPTKPGSIPAKQIKLTDLREDQLDVPAGFRDKNSMAYRAREALGMSTDLGDAPVRAKSSVYDRLIPNTHVLTKVVASTVMHNKIREEEDWEKEVYGGTAAPKQFAPQVSVPGRIGREDLEMQSIIEQTRKQVETEITSRKRESEGVPAQNESKRLKGDDEDVHQPSEPGEPMPHPPPLATLWQQHQAPSGHIYWYNTATGLSQWEPPQLGT